MCFFSVDMPDPPAAPAPPPPPDINRLFEKAKKKKLKKTALEETPNNPLQISRPDEGSSVGTGTNNTGNNTVNY